MPLRCGCGREALWLHGAVGQAAGPILGFGKPKRRASGRACREKLSRRRGGRREQLGKAALLEDDVCGRCAMRNLREILSIVGRWRPRTLLDPVIDAYQASRQRKDHVPDDCQAGARTGPPPRAARPRPKKTKSMPDPYPEPFWWSLDSYRSGEIFPPRLLLQWAVGDGVGVSSARVMLYVSYTGPFQACLFAWHHAISASKFSRVTSWAGR